MKSPTPEYTLPRLIRYVGPGVLPGVNLLAVLDPTQNILRVNRELFDRLDPLDQRATLRTHRTSLTVS